MLHSSTQGPLTGLHAPPTRLTRPILADGQHDEAPLPQEVTSARACAAGLASVADTECIVAKAIRDGGIDAVLDHGAGTMLSKDTPDVYATAEPASAFHSRVAFCLDIHNEVRNLPLRSLLCACA